MARALNDITESYYVGMSTDEKPIDNVQKGDLFHEIDTSNDYRFDKENNQWVLQKSNRWWMVKW